MKTRLPAFRLHQPATLEEALSLLHGLRRAKVLAGGTDLLVSMKRKGMRAENLVSLKGLKDNLSYVRNESGLLRIGAATTMKQLSRDSLILESAPVLAEAASKVGSTQVRNMGTVGGNLCNASPAADTAPPLLVLEAEALAMSRVRERVIPLTEFFVGPGETALDDDELLVEVRLKPPTEAYGAAFFKLGRKHSEDISVVNAAAYLALDGDAVSEARIAVGSSAPTPFRAFEAEAILEGKQVTDAIIAAVAEAAGEAARPITDVRASAAYRREMVETAVRRALEEAYRRAQP